MKKTRTELFFLRQYGFSNKLLETIYLLNMDPITTIFLDLSKSIHSTLKISKKDLRLSEDYNSYSIFKENLYTKDDFFTSENSKIYFKYDDNELKKLIPEKMLPLFMYSKGDVSLLNSDIKRVAIVGTRHPSMKAIEMTKKITKKYVEEGYIIVSGLADGVDTISHETAVEYNGKTIAVLPTNFNKIYPKHNQKLANKILENGLLLTSVGPNEITHKSNFLERNKYVANISNLVIITETNLKSGTMNTIRNASEAKKKILFIDQGDNQINAKIYEFGGELINGKL